jgi:hypothetical protein
MKVSGFSFIRNAVKNDYPIIEAIYSILPLCDDFYLAVGKSEDNTLGEIKALKNPKIHIIETIWDDSAKENGEVFAQETDKAFKTIPKDTDWAFYIQGDECLHEKYIPVVKSAMQDFLDRPEVEGLLLKYIHFYGSYDYYGISRRWYRNEIRIIRNNPQIYSYKDAQGFRIQGRKLRVKLVNATIYHYGWAKSQIGLTKKLKNFNTYYHDEKWLDEHLPDTYIFDYSNADRLLKFTESHPQTMQKRIENNSIHLIIDPRAAGKKMDLRRRLLQWFEDFTKIRLGEYKNYILVK